MFIISSNSWAASRGEGAEQMADTTATPSVPACITSPMVWAFIPPMATVGCALISTARRNPSKPKGNTHNYKDWYKNSN
ncbi:MAG: hypothetical protein IIX00_01400 [Tidjanibacter sp.]|nr:hypothetical protein [Tidjanibacter sp.]